jgi:hypothetical protein
MVLVGKIYSLRAPEPPQTWAGLPAQGKLHALDDGNIGWRPYISAFPHPKEGQVRGLHMYRRESRKNLSLTALRSEFNACKGEPPSIASIQASLNRHEIRPFLKMM